jgi:hypothetical protein
MCVASNITVSQHAPKDGLTSRNMTPPLGYALAAVSCRYLRATDPFSLPDLRDMALCLAEQRPEEAVPLLREYLAVAPGAPDADMVREVQAQVQLRVQLGRTKGWK